MPTPTATPAPVLEPLEVHAESDWIRDQAGRVVLLRGANYSGLEFGNFVGSPHGPQEADFVQMASWGFNVIRLPIAWSYIEPAPNQFSDQYLREQVDVVIGFAARHGILVIPEMHQYYWSPCIGGNGAPAWVCEGKHYGLGDRGALRANCDFFRASAVVPGLVGYDGLAPDGRLLMDHFEDLWRLVAHHYAGDRRIAGFDFFNEPNGACFGFDGTFERMALHPFYRRLRAAVAAEGATQTFFYCPNVIRNLETPTFPEPMGPNVVYAPHLYTETGGSPDSKYDGNAARVSADYELATHEAGIFGGPLIAGEYGGITDAANGFLAATEQFLRDSLAEQDRRLIGGAVWAYFPGDNGFSVVDAEGREKGDLVNILARPYARRIAGIPTAMQFDLDTKEFTLAFRDDPAHQPPDPTEIFVPLDRHYPTGVSVEVSAGDRWELDAAASRVLVYRGPATMHTVRITRSAAN